MRKIILNVISILSLILCIKFKCQDKTIDMYPKMPDAAAASKFVDIPAGNYTGIASFTIPIYTINAGGVKIPLELNYSSNGIKVGEIASRVGLGWSLNTGASLSQQIYGEADNLMGFKKYTLNTLENPPPTTCSSGSNPSNPLCYAFLSAIGVSVYDVLKTDLLPDIFSYQLFDKSGQFIMDFSGEFGIPRPYNQLKIKPISHGMEIVGENGIKYSFVNTPFELEYFSSCQSGTVPINPDFTPQFKIQSVELPNKSVIQYKYLKTVNSTFLSSISEQKNIYNRNSTATASPMTLPPEKCVNKTKSRETVLSEIDFSDGKILFYYNNDQLGFTENVRQDLVGDLYLTRVVVKSPSNQVISDTSLIYNYFISSNDVSSNYPEEAGEYPDTFNRLKLTSVRNNLTTTSYNLKYYGEQEGKNLPNRFSFSQDFWGVYNGQPNDTGIATVKAKNYDGIIKVYKGANKEPDFNYGVIGNLQRIEYESGGFTEIKYESDDYLKNTYVLPLYHYENWGTGDVYDNTAPLVFNIPENSFNKTVTLFDYANPNPQPFDPIDPDGCRYKLEKKVNNSFVTIVNAGTALGTTDRNDQPGIYRLSAFKNIDYKSSSEAKCKAHYDFITENFVSDNETRKAGTLRINKIINNSVDNGEIVRSYTYIDPDTGKSSGKNVGEEHFVPLSYNEVPIPPPCNVYCYGSVASQLNRINNPGWQINTARGKAIGYGYVQETYTSILNPTNNFKKQQKFKNDVSSFYNYSNSSPVNVDWPTLDLDRGQIQEEISFDDKNNRVKHVVYDYDSDYYFNQYATMNYFGYPTNVSTPFIAQAAVVKMKKYDIGVSQEKTYHFNSNVFDINNLWIKNVKTTITDYVNNQPTVVTEQMTAYSTNTGQNRHTFPESQISTVIGSGDTSSQKFKYPLDLVSTEPIAAQMVTANIISTPMETEVIKNGNTLSKTKTNFAKNTDTNNLILPVSVYSKNLDNSVMESQITYDFYDDKGNIRQYTTKAGVSTVIIWGYNQTQPISKIEGAKLSDLTQTQINSIVDASNNDATQIVNNDETSFLGVLDTFRKDLPGFQITTYTYDSLIGVRSITPPSGIREIYKYDASNRLESVKDIDGNILKEYSYKYKQ